MLQQPWQANPSNSPAANSSCSPSWRHTPAASFPAPNSSTGSGGSTSRARNGPSISMWPSCGTGWVARLSARFTAAATAWARAAEVDRVWDEVAEGVILIEGDTVTALNSAAARLLRVNREWAAGQPLFLVLRDHRLEAAWEERLTRVVELGEHFVEVRPTADGLLLREGTDRSEERRVGEASGSR